jgi:hypothetical protein
VKAPRKATRRAKAPASMTEAVLGPAGVLQPYMLLAPFLSFRDLLRLSVAARWLKPFRFQLESLRVRVPPRLTGAKDSVRDMATALISRQQRIKRLSVEEPWLVEPALTALKDGASRGRSLVSLDLSMIWSCGDCTAMMQDLEMALTSGICPALQELKIRYCVLNDDHLTCLAAAVRANAVRGLRVLEIESSPPSFQNGVGIEKLMVAMEAGSCAMLTNLSLSYCRINGGASQALARAVRAGVVPGLTGLKLHYCDAGPGVVAPVVEALAEGTNLP